MLNGAHVVLYSTDVEADRAFLRDVLGLPHVDVGDGWLIFGLPPSEVAVHPLMPDAEGGKHEMYFMCEDIESFTADMAARGVACSGIDDQGWGMLARVTLPSGLEVGVYEPRHARPGNPATPN